MDVAVVGTGYVGLVAGTCLAELGHHVVCVDNNPDKVSMLKAGRLPIYEPGLAELVPSNVAAGRLVFTTELGPAVRAAEVVFIAVGTPPGPDGAANLDFVVAVAEGIAESLGEYKVVAVKSTVPIGTCEKVRAIIASRTKVHFDVVSNPEFLREGVAVPDFMQPDRVVVGCSTERSEQVMRRLYAPVLSDESPLMVMDVRSSELTKYASNAMLATRISFINEIANLCEHVGADVEHVRKGMGRDRRIGPAFLRAGVGYGGSCFPKDVKALIQTARAYDTELQVLDAVERVNAQQKHRLVDTLLADYGADLTGRTFAMWGLAFKPDTDDMREAPAVEIARGLVAAGARVVAFDPAARETARVELGDTITYADEMYACLDGADALLLVTEWEQFASPDWSDVASRLETPAVYDGRNIWDPAEVRSHGFTFRGVGRR